MNLFERAHQRIKNSPLILLIFAVFVVTTVISGSLSYEDYTTSRLGYISLPTRKANEWIVPLVALLPQVGTIAFSYIAISDTSKRWAFMVAGLLQLFDTVTDVAYKAGGMDASVYLIALLESLVLYSIGSELLLTISIGMILVMLPDVGNYLMGSRSRSAPMNEEDDE